MTAATRTTNTERLHDKGGTTADERKMIAEISCQVGKRSNELMAVA